MSLIKKYKTILFDADNTLLEFRVDQKKAFKEAFDEISDKYSDMLFEDYCEINRNMWKKMERKEITLQEVFVKRFDVFFEKYNINADSKEFNELLTLKLQKTGTLMSGVKEVLEKLKDKYELAIVTNGPLKQQYNRLDNAGISHYFKNIFVSEEIGYNKPDTRFFDIVFEKIENKDKSKILIVGDALTADIKGGIDVGIDTCWINLKEKECEVNFKPTYEIKEISEVLNIL